ncbi:XTP/dITP diphosphatase [Virgibacillus sp. NKC19-16]|uniref:XTP/dITP diphosphatase n=1 Tax=Virgibacillus salidurans TaxID=2831673 RepID=UPI001F2249E2|nr:XTP/dITP diphosphatase [Virgibacillus sp. NKC19-16]UJL44991.1 XTP/dITP diphosphatase [Virgibacillus sp. NKC19-16]
MKQIIIATKNSGKATEFKDFFAAYGIEAVSLLDLTEDLPDVEETGTTFEGNALLKAEEIAARLSTPVLADDSGLMVDALNGRPGVYSARYAGEPKDDQANIQKLLDELNTVPVAERSARFICLLAIAIPSEKPIIRKGYCEGSIAFYKKGENGFGYDPIFIPENYIKTMAQLPKDVKNSISHRKKAINQLEEWIKTIAGRAFK